MNLVNQDNGLASGPILFGIVVDTVPPVIEEQPGAPANFQSPASTGITYNRNVHMLNVNLPVLAYPFGSILNLQTPDAFTATITIVGIHPAGNPLVIN